MDSDKLKWIAHERLDKGVSDLYWSDINLSRKHLYKERKSNYSVEA
jgi:hypothetical protein